MNLKIHPYPGKIKQKKHTGKVLLISPPYSNLFKSISGSEWLTPPLGIAYIAAVLERDGHEVRVIDLEAENHFMEKLTNELEHFKPRVVGITATTPTIFFAYYINQAIKNIDKKILTVLGGPHASCLPEEGIEGGFDIVVRGEGEQTIKEIVNHFLSSAPYQDEPGTTLVKNGKIIHNPPRSLINNLDDIAFPARHLLPDYYKTPLSEGKRPVTILTSRGCPYSCNFCNKSIFGDKFRTRSTQNIIKEMEGLINKGYDEFHIIDDTFNLHRNRVEEICQTIIEKKWKIKWALPNGIRIDKIDGELAKLMKRAGCYYLAFGIESGNQKTLDYIQKNLKLDLIKAKVKEVRKAGLKVVASMIIGFPNEDKKDIKKTLEFLMDIKPDVANFHTLIPLPGTKIFKELNDSHMISTKNWSKYTFHDLPVFRTEHMSPEEIHELYIYAYLKYHLRFSYIISKALKIKSLREFKNNINGLITLLKHMRNSETTKKM